MLYVLVCKCYYLLFLNRMKRCNKLLPYFVLGHYMDFLSRVFPMAENDRWGHALDHPEMQQAKECQER